MWEGCGRNMLVAVISRVGEESLFKLLDRSSWDVEFDEFTNHLVIQGSFVL